MTILLGYNSLLLEGKAGVCQSGVFKIDWDLGSRSLSLSKASRPAFDKLRLRLCPTGFEAATVRFMENKFGMVDASSVVTRASDVMTSNVADELVMIRLESDGYFGLDAIGRRIWELLDEPRTVGAICSSLLEEYDVEPAECEVDVRRFLGELQEHGVITVENPDVGLA